MTAATHVYKIRDKKTGLYWGGRKGCVEKVGTRFVTKSALKSTMDNIIKDKHGRWPPNWIVETVRLVEIVVETRSSNQVIIDHCFQGLVQEAIAARGIEYYYAETAALIIDQMRRKGKFESFMVLMQQGDDSPKMKPNDLRKFVKDHGGDPKCVEKHARGWWAVQDLRTATLLRMNSAITAMIDVNQNVAIAAKRLDAKPEDLIRAA